MAKQALPIWCDVDRYIAGLFIPPDAALDGALQSSAQAGLPAINVTPNQGKLLMMLAQIQGARSILEIGTLGGYSTIWLARGLPADGRLVTLENDPKHAQVARRNIAAAGLDGIVELRLGPALQTLPLLESEGRAPFDLIFIDADKSSTPDYFAWALKLGRRGGIIIVDNVVRDGKVIETDSDDPSILGIRRFNEMVAAEPRVAATAIQTVGGKGYDGLALVRIIADP